MFVEMMASSGGGSSNQSEFSITVAGKRTSATNSYNCIFRVEDYTNFYIQVTFINHPSYPLNLEVSNDGSTYTTVKTWGAVTSSFEDIYSLVQGYTWFRFSTDSTSFSSILTCRPNYVSGVSPISTKRGLTEAASYGTQITIDTGLSEINYFSWLAKVPGYNRSLGVQYIKDYDSNVFNTAAYGNSASYDLAIGASAQTYVPVITSINNGIIVLNMPTNSPYGNAGGGYWVAS